MSTSHRIAIVNRGDPARRLIQAAREFAAEGRGSLTTIALHTAAERTATYVREADEAQLVAGDPAQPFADLDELGRALRACDATAVWVGWGFVAEDPEFADLCERMGLLFIGPPAGVIRRLSDKIAAKSLAEEAGLTVADWSRGPVASVDEARSHAERIGYPVMVKAAMGHGGQGVAAVSEPGALEAVYLGLRDGAGRVFGDDRVFLERVIAGARCIEVDVVVDDHGVAWSPGLRDCSLQRRSRKLIEESGSPVLDPGRQEEIRRAAVELMVRAGYRNAGTVEFLHQPEDGGLYFTEVNPRLQVGHAVTEATAGLDLVKLQLHVAMGGGLEPDPPVERGHAVEVRINAQDAERGFATAAGELELLALPTGPGIRVDTGLSEGDVIPPDYDALIAKVVAWGRDRDESFARLRRAVGEMAVVVRGGATNRSLLLDLLDRPEVVDGTADIGWIDRLDQAEGLVSERGADIALIEAAINTYDHEEAIARDAFYASARRGRPKAPPPVGASIRLHRRGQGYAFSVSRTAPSRYRLTVDGSTVVADVERLGRFGAYLHIGDRRHRVVTVSNDPDHVVEVAGVAHRIARDEGRLVRAPAPSLVVSVAASVGDELREGDPVAVLESMKMETAVPAPFDGVVREVLVAGNVQVDAGAPLVRMEPLRPDQEGEPGPRVGFGELGGAAATAPDLAVLDEIGSLFSGFDEGEKEAAGLADRLAALHAERPGDRALIERAIALLGMFTDIAELTRNRPPLGALEFAEEAVRSPLEHFHRYLRSLDAYHEGLHAALRESLARALAHYGVADLAPGPELAEAAYRIFLAEQRAPAQLPAVSALLEICRAEAQRLPPDLESALRETLNRLVTATEVRHPAVGELARSVRFACFDQPAAEHAQEEAYRAVNDVLDGLVANPDADDHEARIAEVIESSYRLIGLLGRRTGDGPSERDPLLEVLTRRYYKIRELHGLHHTEFDGRRYLTATYDRERRTVRLVASLGMHDDLDELLAGVREVLAAEDPTDSAVADLYLARGGDRDADEMADELRDAARAAGLPDHLRRLAVSVAMTDGSVEQFTFRPGAEGLEEERVVRGMHPMIARRLRFWRLKNFDVARLPSSEDNYVFLCTGGDEGAEERFVALSEVRDLNPVRGDAGQVISLPVLEQTLARCLEDLRRARAQRPGAKRLQSNQIFLYVWPPVPFPVDELVAVARALGPITEGVGLEEVLVHIQVPEAGGPARDLAIRFSYQPGAGVEIDVVDAPDEPVGHLDSYREKVLASRRRGTVYPYELVRMAMGPGGRFEEHDLIDDGTLVPVDRPPGENTAGIVAGVVVTPTDRHPEGMARVALFGDPTRALGSVAEPECARILAAIDLADSMGVPLEWYALSAGAKISRDTGTENMDWVSRVLRRIITFTQDGGEINVVVAGINVGAQPYWNAEATMLMHTRGALIMTPDSAMVLTGKQALDYSGGVSAEDNLGIGGYDRIMGPNGQAQYWAPDLAGACRLLLDYYAHTYVAPGERFPRRAHTEDPLDRDVREHVHEGPGTDFRTAGEIFSADSNPDRKRPFDIRSLMNAVADQDHPTLERWAGMADAETVVVYDAHLGGIPHAMIGIESRPLPRHHMVPADGPDVWTAGTLFPVSSKKAARAINAASGNRPLVVLANLTGFDGSPESLRKCQLEYGAEIGRAVVNFDGPIVFCVVSRYHGGAFVVFSAALNDQMEVLAVEGSYASVIGGAPAAAVVFARDVNKRTDADARVTELEARLAAADEADRGRLRAELGALRADVRSEMLGQVADEFDQIHSVERALDVGSVHAIIPAARLRPLLIDAIERGMARTESGV